MSDPVKNIAELTAREFGRATPLMEKVVVGEVDAFLKALPDRIRSTLEKASMSLIGLKKDTWDGWTWDSGSNSDVLKKTIMHHASEAAKELVTSVINDACARVNSDLPAVREMMVTTYVRAYRDELKQALRRQAATDAKEAVSKLVAAAVPSLAVGQLFKKFDPAEPVAADDAFKTMTLEMQIQTGELKV